MIIRRQLYSQNNLRMNNGMEFKPIYKKTSESGPAPGSNSIVRDVEDLLKPIQRPKQNEEANSLSTRERTERNLWRNDEVMEMLYTMQQVKALEKLNDKTVKSENVFKDVEVIMHKNGFIKKSHVQIWTKWKFLKSTYMTSRRNGVVPRMVPPQIYETIHQMISGLNQSMADSCSSADGDNSSVNGMVISGIEEGVSEVGANEDDEDSFGMAHPIFGFRLGMVKSEPEDTGYEAVEKNDSDKDPLEESSSSRSHQEVKEESKRTEAQNQSKEPDPVQRVLEIPHRGRGRPPKYPPAATSTPNSIAPSSTKSQMPPLRVAPFARALRSENYIATSRPPPPLTMPPTPRIQVASMETLKNGDPGKFAQPKLIPKPSQQLDQLQQQQSLLPVVSTRTSKEQTAQIRSSSTPSPSYPKMKQIPMRKTPYSLRPDRAIPDLESSLSPPPVPIERSSNKKIDEVPSTKHLQQMQSNSHNLQNIGSRKKRMDWQDPIPSKQPRYSNTLDEERNNTKMDENREEYDKNYGKVLQNVIIDLSSSLRKMQTGMMRDFFNKQNELLEKEHQFQMQQDLMIMKAFQEQTQDIMHSVRQLVGSIKTYKTYQQNDSEENLRHSKRSRNYMLQQMDLQEEDMEMEHDQMIDDDGNNEENDIEEEQAAEDHDQENVRGTGDLYTDAEEQPDQLEGHDQENNQEETENIANEEEEEEHENDNQAQLAEEQHENALAAKDNIQNGLRIISDDLNDHE